VGEDKLSDKLYDLTNKLLTKIERKEEVSYDTISICCRLRGAVLLALCEEAVVMLCPRNNGDVVVCVFTGEKGKYKKVVSIGVPKELFRYRTSCAYTMCEEMTTVEQIRSKIENDDGMYV